MDGNWVPNLQQEKGVVSSSQEGHQSQDCNEEEDDEESESSALNNFRKQWEAELMEISTGQKNNTPNQNSTMSTATAPTPTQFNAVSPSTTTPRRQSTSHSPVPSTSTCMDKIEEEARKFFLMGVSFERRGDLYDAVKFYRRAMQLVPDIEKRLQSEVREEKSDDESEEEVEDGEYPNLHDKESDDEGEDVRSLYLKFIQRIEGNEWTFFEQFKDDSKTHFKDLPVEVIMYILRWVISSDLDVRSLDTLATVCRGFYCLSRDEKLWKMACDRVWSSSEILESQFSTYREMFLSRPRVRFDGCYISRITYVRPGEHSFQDASYRPWHMVEYFRYIRFFPDGKLYFLTTAEKPISIVGLLRDRSVRNTSILKGTYRLYGNNVVSASVRKFNPPTSNQDRPGGGRKVKSQSQDNITEFNMDFEIEDLKKKNNWIIRWTYYSVHINNSSLRHNNNNRNNNGENDGGITTTFELAPNKYPPLYFSRVKSYNLNAENILE